MPTLSQPRADYVIGAKPFAEQYVLAALIEQRLRGAAAVGDARRDGLGSSVIFNALAAGEIDAYVDYSGTIWTNQMHRSDVKPRAEVLAEMTRWLEREHGITVLGGLGFENAYALAMPRAARAGARHPLARRSRRPRAELFDRRRLRILRPAGMGRRSARPTASPSASSARCSRSSCIRRRRAARST